MPTTPSTSTTPTAPPGDTRITYTVKGRTQLERLGATLPLGPGEFAAKLDASGRFTGRLSLPQSQLRFRLFGLFPASATVRFAQLGDVTGTLAGGSAKATAKIDVRLPSVRVFGFPILTSTACHTGEPVTVPLTSSPGFDPLKGGKLTAEYTLPGFRGCGFLTPLISLLASGDGNTLEAHLTKK
ncbi:hypothetical protein GCM10023192_04070 [Amycolatopsis samaneae]